MMWNLMRDDPPDKEIRGRHRIKVENEMVKKREKEFQHKMMWEGAQNYYKRWDTANTKYDNWTSPRYYQENNKMLIDLKDKKSKEERLDKRRKTLKKLFQEENDTYQIELMMNKNNPLFRNNAALSSSSTASSAEEVPIDVLKDVNNELKRKDEEKRKREAELKLYHQWRINNPLVRQLESKYRFKDLKLSWLDQQIEKRMEKENEEKVREKFIKEQNERLKREQEREESYKKNLELKKSALKANLEMQIKELNEKQQTEQILRTREKEEIEYKKKVQELSEIIREEERKRLAKENAIFNIRQHKLKLKQRAADIQDGLIKDQEFIMKMNNLHLAETIADAKKKEELKNSMTEFLSIINSQKELEKQRQKHFEFLFDSEANAIYQKQLNLWKQEENARQKLLKSVLNTVNQQLEENLQENWRTQKELLKEKEEMFTKIEAHDKELESLKMEQENRKQQIKSINEKEIKLKKVKGKQEECAKLKDLENDLQRIKQEDERLRKEIMEIQKRQGSCRPKSNFKLY